MSKNNPKVLKAGAKEAATYSNGEVMQVFVPGHTQQKDFTGVPVDIDTPFRSNMIEVLATQTCWLLMKEGGALNTAAALSGDKPANNIRVQAGIYKVIPTKPGWTMSIIRDAVSGTLFFAENDSLE